MFWEYVAPGSGPTYIDTNDVVHYGDHIYAWVHYNYSGCSNGFYAHVEDDSPNPHLHLGSTCIIPSQGIGHQSAEWIDERPAVSCYDNDPLKLPYLADFNYIGWSDVLAQANYSGAQWQNPNSFANTQLLIYDDSTQEQLASPDGLQVGNDNTFLDRWYNYGTNYSDCT